MLEVTEQAQKDARERGAVYPQRSVHPVAGVFGARQPVADPVAARQGLDVPRLQGQPPMPPEAGVAVPVDTSSAPLMAASHSYGGSAQVQVIDASGASPAWMRAQLGAPRPSGLPGQPAEGIAPTGVGAVARVNPAAFPGVPVTSLGAHS